MGKIRSIPNEIQKSDILKTIEEDEFTGDYVPFGKIHFVSALFGFIGGGLFVFLIAIIDKYSIL